MTKNSKKFDIRKLKGILPYILTGVITLTIVAVGSISKYSSEMNLSLNAFAKDNFKISVDQLSGLYTVANVSNMLGLASASDMASTYVVASSLYASGQSSTDKPEKPPITNIPVSRGVIEYIVQDGDSMESIAAKYGVSTDQIRWSNGKKTADITLGEVLYIPSKPGIVYTVKSGESIEDIVSKYGSNVAEVVALNDLELSGVSEGMRILINGGSLPETERPEYVPPVVVRPVYTYTYLGDTSARVNKMCVYNQGFGQCVGWALRRRPDLNFQANANGWDDLAKVTGHLVDQTPAAGAIFQTDSGWYGHVGYVESVNADGSVNVSEWNYWGCNYGTLYSTIPASEANKFNYIH